MHPDKLLATVVFAALAVLAPIAARTHTPEHNSLPSVDAVLPTIETSSRMTLFHGAERPTSHLACSGWRGPADDQTRDCTWIEKK